MLRNGNTQLQQDVSQHGSGKLNDSWLREHFFNRSDLPLVEDGLSLCATFPSQYSPPTGSCQKLILAKNYSRSWKLATTTSC